MLPDYNKSITGSILGCALGDSIGLPMEGLPAKRQKKMFKNVDGHNFLPGKGMISDDTEHTLMVAESIVESGGDPEAFSKALAKRLKIWFLSLPAGVGFATLRGCLKLLLGTPPDKSGVFSAGNGPAMRSAIIGVVFGHDVEKMKKFVRISTRMTHTDPKAEWGALAAALAAWKASITPARDLQPENFYLELSDLLGEEASEFLALIKRMVTSLKASETTASFADSLGLQKGVTGYVFHTMPVVLHAWLRNPTLFKEAMIELIRCGGDTDTGGAILGSIMGSALGKIGLPADWLNGIWEWPRSVEYMTKVSTSLITFARDNTILTDEDADENSETNDGENKKKEYALPPFNPLFTYPRNFLFTIIVLTHGFRRLLPPY